MLEKSPVKYSVVIPLKNEEENLLDLIEELEAVMNSLGSKWNLILVDDGSTDQTPLLIEETVKNKKYAQALFFFQNYGQSSAFAAGFKVAKGEFVITLDGDLQNDPADIPKLITHVDTFDLVCGERRERQDPWSKKIVSFFANKIRNFICQDGIQDTGCSLKVYRKKCLDQIKMYDGMHRFLPALFLMEGFRVTKVAVNHRRRIKGKTKYNFFNRFFKTIVDLFAVHWMQKRHLKYEIKKELFNESKNFSTSGREER